MFSDLNLLHVSILLLPWTMFVTLIALGEWGNHKRSTEEKVDLLKR